MEETKEKQLLQWHPAFFSGIQIELEAYADNLEFENEHQIGKKPKEVDVLIIKKDVNKPIHKNIGRIFRKYNIIEYKSPTDYLNIDDFYKVYGYACFYKADTGRINQIKIEEITISLVCHGYPRKLIKHLKHHGYEVNRIENGIYYIEGDRLPIQLILTSRLSKKENMWLRSLTNTLKDKMAAKKLVTEYEIHRNDSRYESIMDLIIRANKGIFQEVDEMCEALDELIEDKVEARTQIRVREVLKIKMEELQELQDRVEEELQTRVEEELQTRVEEELQTRVEEELQTRVEEELQTRVEEELQTRVEEELQTRIEEALQERVEDVLQMKMEEKTKTIVANMLKRGMSDEDICALAECDKAILDQVRQEVF